MNRGPFARPPWQVTDWSDTASCADRGFWRRWHAGALRPPGRRTSPRGKHLPCRHPGRQLNWLLPARLDRPIHAQSSGDFAGLARGHCRRFLRRLHNVLKLRLGNRQDARRRRVAPRHRLRISQRGCRLATERRRHPSRQQVLRMCAHSASVHAYSQNVSS